MARLFYSFRVRRASRGASRIFLVLLTLNSPLVTLSARGGSAYGGSYPQDTQENANFKLAVNLYNDGMYDLALEQFKQFINSYPNTQNSVEARFYLGLTHLKLKQFDEARIAFQTFALAYPEHVKAPEAWWKTGEAYAEMHNYKEAGSAYERVKIFHPKSNLAPDALIKSSEYFVRAGDLQNAKQVLRTLIDEYGTSATVLNARLLLGTLYANEGNHQQALAEFDRVLSAEAPPELKAQAFVSRGKTFQRIGRVEEAEKDFRHVTSNFRTTVAALNAFLELGKIQQNYGQHLEAIASFQQLFPAAASVRPSSGQVDTTLQQEALIAMGDSYMKLLDYLNALATYEQFIGVYPKNERLLTVYVKAGLALEKQKQYARANAYYARVLKIAQASEPDRHAAFLLSARNAAALKRYQEAANFYAEFLEQYPEHPAAAQASYSTAQIYENELQDYPRAILAYDRFRTEYPRHVNVDDALFGLARCHEKSKQFERAIEAYEDLLRLYPASELIGEARRRSEFITNFERKDKDKGLEKLALLIGDVLSQRSRGELSFRLAEIYFHDLKDYIASAREYANAINLGLKDELLIEAYFLRARSFELLSSNIVDLADSALVYYEAFLKLYPTSRWSESAAYARFTLSSRSKSPEETLKNAEQFLALYGTSRYADDVLNDAAQSALQRGNHRLAIRLSRRMLSQYGKSDGVGRALDHLASAYLSSGKADSAAQFYSQYVQRYPDGEHAASALNALATLSADSNRAEEAISSFQTLMDRYFYTSLAESARVALGYAYLAAEQYENAQKHFASLLAEVSNTPLASAEHRAVYLYPLATAMLKSGDRQGARKHYLEFLTFDRTSKTAGEAYYTLGTIARDEGNAELATGFFKRASALTGEARAAREAAELFFKSGQYSKAIEEFSSLAQSTKDPKEKRHFESRIIVSSLRAGNLGDAQKRIAAFQKLYTDAEVELAEFLYETGTLQFRNQDYASAQKTFEQIMKEHKETRFLPWAHYWSGKLLEVTEKVPEAKTKFDEILKNFPTSDVVPRVHLALGNIFYNAEQYDEAARHFSFILDNSEAAPDLVYYAMNNLILAQQEVGLYDAALNLARQFIERYPNDESIIDKKVKIGVLYERLGYHDQAIVHLQSLLNVADSDLEAEIRYYIGESFYAKSDYQQAILEFLKVPYLVTKKTRIDWTANAFYMAGQTYERMNKYDLAINMYQQIINRAGIDPTFKAAAQKEIDRVRSLMKTGSKP